MFEKSGKCKDKSLSSALTLFRFEESRKSKDKSLVRIFESLQVQLLNDRFRALSVLKQIKAFIL